MQTMSEQTYNGWKNYPTWSISLWLANDEGTYNVTLELVRLAKARGDDLVRVRAADMIRDLVRDDLAPDLGASFAADLLGYALDQVDWFEIADSWLEDLADED